MCVDGDGSGGSLLAPPDQSYLPPALSYLSVHPVGRSLSVGGEGASILVRGGRWSSMIGVG